MKIGAIAICGLLALAGAVAGCAAVAAEEQAGPAAGEQMATARTTAGQPDCLPPGTPAVIAHDSRFMAGDTESPVVLTIYACGRSQLCADLIPRLFAEITAGRLRGRVRMYYRPFFPEGQPEAATCGRVLVAAAGQGMFWPFLLQLYAHHDDFRACLLRQWAYVTGLDRGVLDAAWDHPDTVAYLDAARREAAANNVVTAPAAFINGRRVGCDLSFDLVYDLLLREYRSATR